MEDKKIDFSLNLIKEYAKQHPLTIAYSGGKDSDVILRLAQLAHIKVDVVHNVTTIDPPGTITHCVKAGAIISRPRYTFFQLMEKRGWPTMFRRFCCGVLKERYIADYVILGIRRQESVKRSIRYKEPEACRIYSRKMETIQIMPILYWSLADIEEFVLAENLKLHSVYYDSDNRLCIENRLGCIGCPLQGDRGVSHFLKYPKMLRLWVKAYLKWHKGRTFKNSPYESVVWYLFYSNHKKQSFEQTYHGLFEKPDAKAFLEDYFHVDLP